MFSWRKPYRLPIIVAHRGSSAMAPENTLAAFRQAIEGGADAIELDVRLTGDDKVVVIHDARLERTTDGHGKVCDFSLKELKRFSAGRWFHRRYMKERIPTLIEVLEIAQGKIALNIEIKTEKKPKQRFEIIEQCYNIIHSYDAEEAVLISSFFIPFIKRMKLYSHRIATSLLYHPVYHFGKSPIRIASSVKADYLILNGLSINPKIVSRAHAKQILVGEYTINTPRRFSHALRLGVDAIITNNPALFVKSVQGK
jgi:glycerophosphoryl diester phosphodiesterase